MNTGMSHSREAALNRQIDQEVNDALRTVGTSEEQWGSASNHQLEIAMEWARLGGD